jgi:Thoeris protein ThsB, TIR-like domain
MPQEQPYKIFVSHAWHPHDDYTRLFEYLGDATDFYYVNLSTPDVPPSDTSRTGIEAALARQIGPAEVVVILGGMYDEHKDMLDLEMALAKKHARPIIGLRPSGSQVVPKGVEARATEIVVWSTRSIVDAIKLLARGEQTNRFEVIDFDG